MKKVFTVLYLLILFPVVIVAVIAGPAIGVAYWFRDEVYILMERKFGKTKS